MPNPSEQATYHLNDDAEFTVHMTQVVTHINTICYEELEYAMIVAFTMVLQHHLQKLVDVVAKSGTQPMRLFTNREREAATKACNKNVLCMADPVQTFDLCEDVIIAAVKFVDAYDIHTRAEANWRGDILPPNPRIDQAFY